MLVLAEILALIVLNALAQAALARWKIARRAGKPARAATTRVSFHHPFHPSPAGNAFRFDTAPERTAHVRPAGIDW